MRQPGAEVFAHFVHATANRFHIAQVAQAGLAQTYQQASVRQPVLQAEQPGVELVGALDGEHASIVFDRRQAP
jgi:hypothetical protein